MIFATLLFFTSPQVSLGIAAIGAILIGLAQLLIARSAVAVSQEQLDLMRRQEQRELERVDQEIPDLKASIEFKAKSQLAGRGISADASFNALITLENHGRGTAEKVTLTASRIEGEPLVRQVGLIKGGDTRFVVLPLELGTSIEATPRTVGRSILIEFAAAGSPIIFKMTQTHPPSWEVQAAAR